MLHEAIETDLDSVESAVKSYCRSYNAEFDRAKGSYIYDVSGNRYLDFLTGCGSVNYGHNNSTLKCALLEYLNGDGVVMSMDMHTKAKKKFMESFRDLILLPRCLDYKIQFPGPTGTNSIEAAIKLARKMTNRENVISFTNGFHGCTLGSLALTGSAFHRSNSRGNLHNVSRMPYEGYFGPATDTADMIERLLDDQSSGIDQPAAIILESVQGEGGLNACSAIWAQKIQGIARKHGAALIVDDVQAGCGRTGSFFSFEPLGIKPDIVCLAKAISGFGSPMSLILIQPEWDGWSPGEHNGTFRGNNLAFVTAAKALEEYWTCKGFETRVRALADVLRDRLGELAHAYGLVLRGRGLMSGLAFKNGEIAGAVKSACFDGRLIIECSGPDDEVLKLLPPLTVSDEELDEGLAIISTAIRTTC